MRPVAHQRHHRIPKRKETSALSLLNHNQPETWQIYVGNVFKHCHEKTKTARQVNTGGGLPPLTLTLPIFASCFPNRKLSQLTVTFRNVTA